jgi:hypothetical protein
MVCPKFLNSLRQPLGNNSWPTHPTNQNYRMWFHKQGDYLFRFQAKRRISESFLLWNWPKNASNAKDDEYKTFVFPRKLDSLVSASYITRNPEEEESSPLHTEDAMTHKRRRRIFSHHSRDMRDNLGRYDLNTYTTICNGFQWTKQLTNGTQLSSIYPKHNL